MTDKEKDDLFYLCSLVEYIGRKTNNHRGEVVKMIGKDGLRYLYSVASVNHCLSFEQVSFEVIEKYDIKNGDYDTVSNCKYDVPNYKNIEANFKRLIISVNSGDIIDTLYGVFTSFIADVITNFNSDFFYQNDDYIKECYLAGKVLD